MGSKQPAFKQSGNPMHSWKQFNRRRFAFALKEALNKASFSNFDF
jgi:hypothetical protein